MHPEVLARLQRLGISAPGAPAQGNSSPSNAGYTDARSASSGSNAKPAGYVAKPTTDVSESPVARSLIAEEMARPQSAETQDETASVHDPNSMDDLLLQLEDLDARNMALQKQSATESKAWKEDAKTRALLNKERVRPPRPAPIREEPIREQCMDSGSLGDAGGVEVDACHDAHISGDGDGVGTSAASSIAGKHPLDGVRLGSLPQGDAMQQTWRHRRGDRPPVAPGTPVHGGATVTRVDPSAISPTKGNRMERRCRNGLNASTSSLPPAPSSARGSCGDDSRGSPSLPPLKPSASAPGRLGAHDTSWLKQIHRSAC